MEPNLLSWTFISECAVPKKVEDILIEGETAHSAYKTIRDMAIFTNKRLIIRDVQGLTGKKIETYSIPYSNINMWSTENAGRLDLNAEVTLWTRSGTVKINLKRGVDVAAFDQLLAAAVLP